MTVILICDCRVCGVYRLQWHFKWSINE